MPEAGPTLRFRDTTVILEFDDDVPEHSRVYSGVRRVINRLEADSESDQTLIEEIPIFVSLYAGLKVAYRRRTWGAITFSVKRR